MDIKKGDWVIYRWAGEKCKGKVFGVWGSTIELEKYHGDAMPRQIMRLDVICVCEGENMSHHTDICDVCGFVTCRCDKKEDKVNHPKHYTFGTIEVITVIEDWDLGFHEGNCIKYIARAKHKGNELEDLKKAQWYLNRRIEDMELDIAAADDKEK